MKRIILSAYLNNNLGDDLFVYTIVNRYPECIFYIDTDCMRTTFLDNSNIVITNKYFHYFNRLIGRLTKKKSFISIKKMDALVKIGGSIFIDYDGWKENWPSFKRGPLYILGANYGPSRSEGFKQLVEKEIKFATDCCFRDSYSFNTFKTLNNVRMAPDILFGFKPKYDISYVDKTVGISVISLDNREGLKSYATQYYKGVSCLCDRLSEYGFNVILFAFCSNEGDKDAVDIIERNSKYKVNKQIYNGKIDETITSLQRCEYIIATRLHAMIIGWALGKKVYPIIYSEKQLNIIDDMCENIPFIKLEEVKTDTIEEIINAMQKIEPIDVIEYAKKSEKHFSKFDEFVSS